QDDRRERQIASRAGDVVLIRRAGWQDAGRDAHAVLRLPQERDAAGAGGDLPEPRRALARIRPGGGRHSERFLPRPRQRFSRFNLRIVTTFTHEALHTGRKVMPVIQCFNWACLAGDAKTYRGFAVEKLRYPNAAEL